jgi:hypothetical protein
MVSGRIHVILLKLFTFIIPNNLLLCGKILKKNKKKVEAYGRREKRPLRCRENQRWTPLFAGNAA